MICAITETWLSNEENNLRYKEILPTGYKILSKPHTSGKKGGIAVVYKGKGITFYIAPLDHMVSGVLYNLTPGRGLTQPWYEPSP